MSDEGDEDSFVEDEVSYYAVLGVPTDATPAEIRRAFLQLSKRYHTDKHSSGSPELQEAMRARFEELSTAYTVLSDPRKRVAYDLKGRRGTAHLALVPRTTQSPQDIIDIVRSLDRAASLKEMSRMLSASSHVEMEYSTIPLQQWWSKRSEKPQMNESPGPEPRDVDNEVDTTPPSLGDVLKGSTMKVVKLRTDGGDTIVLIPDQDIIRNFITHSMHTGSVYRPENGQSGTTSAVVPLNEDALKLYAPLILGVRALIPTSLWIQHSFEHALTNSAHLKIGGRSVAAQPPSLYTALVYKDSESQREFQTTVITSIHRISMAVSRVIPVSELWSLKTKLCLFDGINILKYFKIAFQRLLAPNILLENILTMSLFGHGSFTSSLSSSDWLVQTFVGPGNLKLTGACSTEVDLFSTKVPKKKSQMASGQFIYSMGSMPIAGVTMLGWKFLFRKSKYFTIGLGFQVAVPYCWSPFAPPYFMVQSSSVETTTNTVQLLYERGAHSITIPIAVFASETLSKSFLWLCTPLVLMRLGILLYHPFAKARASRYYASERLKHVTEMDIARQKALMEQEAIRDSVTQSQEMEKRKSGLVIISAMYGVLFQEYHHVEEEDVAGSPTIHSCVERPPFLTRTMSNVIQWVYRIARTKSNLDFPVPGSSEMEKAALFLDVTVPLQNYVRDSTLSLPKDTKSGLTGFYNPDPYTAEQKLLKIVYLFRGKTHVALFNDEDEVLIPQREHLQEDRRS